MSYKISIQQEILMTLLSLRLPDNLLETTESRAKFLQVPRAEYVRRAIVAMNDNVLAQSKRERLMQVSLLVREESMRVNAEFDAFEGETLA
jgi:predicted DNA-binding protein